MASSQSTATTNCPTSVVIDPTSAAATTSSSSSSSSITTTISGGDSSITSTSNTSTSNAESTATSTSTSTSSATATAGAGITATSPASPSSIPPVPPLPEGPDPYCLGSTFPCLDAFRDALLAHTVHRRLSYKVAKCSWYAYVVTCRDPHCSFKIRGVYARKPGADCGYNGPAAGPLPANSTSSTPTSTTAAGNGAAAGAAATATPNAAAGAGTAVTAAAAAAAAAGEGDSHVDDAATTAATHLPVGPDTRSTPVIYPPSNPSDAHPDYHWRVSIAIPHSHSCSQDHSSWKHAISYLKRGGLPARRSVHSRNGFGIGRPRIGGIVIPGPDDPQKLQHQLQQQSRYQRLQQQLQSMEQEQKVQQPQKQEQQAQQRDDSLAANGDYSVKRFPARPPASKRQKIANPSAVQMVSYYFEDENQQHKSQRHDMAHHPLHASAGSVLHRNATHGNASTGVGSYIPPQISVEASFYLLSTLRYDPSFTRSTDLMTSPSVPTIQRHYKSSISSTSSPIVDLNTTAHQSPYYLLPYHVARLLAGARAFGWTRAVESLSDGYSAGRWGSKTGSLTGLQKLVKVLDEQCLRGLRPQSEQQQQVLQPGLSESASVPAQGRNGSGEVNEESQPLRVRILLSSNGRIEVQTNPLPTRVNEHIFFLTPPASPLLVSAYPSAQSQPPFTFATLRQMHPHVMPWEVRIDTRSVTPSLFTRHKSTVRDVYTAARRRVGITGPNGTEVLVWNDNGEVMEGSVCSVYFCRKIARTSRQQLAQDQHHMQMSPQHHSNHHQQETAAAVSSGELPGTNGTGLPDSHVNVALSVHMSPAQEQDDHSPMPMPPPTVLHQVPSSMLSARDTWVTPPLSSGCNASTTRAYALAKGMCREETVRADSIVDGEEVWLSNGLRGFIPGIIRFRWTEETNGAENSIFQ